MLVAGAHTVRPGLAGGAVALDEGPRSPWLTRPGETYRYEATRAGTFPYACEVHLEMNGVIRVERA